MKVGFYFDDGYGVEELSHDEKKACKMAIKALKKAPVKPTKKICEHCQEWDENNPIDGACYCRNFKTYTGAEFYCGDWVQKRGGVDELKTEG